MEKELEKIAMLIDADNYNQIDKIEPAILEISKYGKISLKILYETWIVLCEPQFSSVEICKRSMR